MLWNVGQSDVINFKFAFEQKAFLIKISFYAESLDCTGSNQLKGKLCKNVKIPCEKKKLFNMVLYSKENEESLVL